jgi:mRNA-degrading endonuclease RelE of RelBE toxin-antitoxin system
MRYTVVWRQMAENQLASIWLQASDPHAVQQASDRIDHLLRNSSFARGNDRAGLYELTVSPLRVLFAVSPDDRIVTVLRVLQAS